MIFLEEIQRILSELEENIWDWYSDCDCLAVAEMRETAQKIEFLNEKCKKMTVDMMRVRNGS